MRVFGFGARKESKWACVYTFLMIAFSLFFVVLKAFMALKSRKLNLIHVSICFCFSEIV